jgi:hypothetical protein
MIERRTTQRHRVLKGGTIAFDGNDLACTVRNLSANGAALDLAYSVSLPPSFIAANRIQSACSALPPGLEQRQANRRRVRLRQRLPDHRLHVP